MSALPHQILFCNINSLNAAKLNGIKNKLPSFPSSAFLSFVEVKIPNDEEVANMKKQKMPKPKKSFSLKTTPDLGGFVTHAFNYLHSGLHHRHMKQLFHRGKS